MKYYIFNVKLQSTSRSGYGAYLTLFETAFQNKKPINLRGDKQAILREYIKSYLEQSTLYNKHYTESNEKVFFYGNITRFTHISNRHWLNIKTAEIEDNDEIPKDKFPNAQDIDFFFFPQMHRMFIRTEKVGVNALLKFLQGYFENGISTEENLNIHIEQSSQVIEMIKNARELHRLEVLITPTNSDPIGDDIQKFIDKDSRASKSSAIKITYNDSKRKEGLIRTPFMTAIIDLARRNGEVVAKIFDGYRKKTIKTTEHPDQKEVKKEKGQEKKEVGIKLFEMYDRDEHV